MRDLVLWTESRDISELSSSPGEFIPHEIPDKGRSLCLPGDSRMVLRLDWDPVLSGGNPGSISMERLWFLLEGLGHLSERLTYLSDRLGCLVMELSCTFSMDLST